jgi:hypothetical protein
MLGRSYNKYNIGGGLDLGVSKLKKFLYLYGKQPKRSIIILLVVLPDDVFLLFILLGVYDSMLDLRLIHQACMVQPLALMVILKD